MTDNNKPMDSAGPTGYGETPDQYAPTEDDFKEK